MHPLYKFNDYRPHPIAKAAWERRTGREGERKVFQLESLAVWNMFTISSQWAWFIRNELSHLMELEVKDAIKRGAPSGHLS